MSSPRHRTYGAYPRLSPQQIRALEAQGERRGTTPAT